MWRAVGTRKRFQVEPGNVQVFLRKKINLPQPFATWLCVPESHDLLEVIPSAL